MEDSIFTEAQMVPSKVIVAFLNSIKRRAGAFETARIYSPRINCIFRVFNLVAIAGRDGVLVIDKISSADGNPSRNHS